MPDLHVGESIEVQGSARQPYVLKNVGGVYSCSCPAWRNQSLPIERRTCKHLRKLRGDDAEQARVGPIAARGAPREAKVAPPLLLAQAWEPGRDVNGWWLSEKLDGVRAYGDGRRFLSRQGNAFRAPEWFTTRLPPAPLDGELWLGRKAFQATLSIVRRHDEPADWRRIAYVVFDAPAVSAPFETRLAHLQAIFREHSPPFASLIEQRRCGGANHLQEALFRIESLGGEGLMLRQPGSLYEAGRSDTLLKVKTFRDAEAIVVAHVPGRGRHRGRLGALRVRRPDGSTFSVGTGFTDAERAQPPPPGTAITYRYQELTAGGAPRFPTFVRVSEHGQITPSQTTTSQTTTSQTTTSQTTTSQTTTNQTTTSQVQDSRARPPCLAHSLFHCQEPSMSKRRFEFVEGRSRKFWEIDVDQRDVTVCFGRLGTAGQTQTKSFNTPEEATRHAEKLIATKLKKGYRDLVLNGRSSQEHLC